MHGMDAGRVHPLQPFEATGTIFVDPKTGRADVKTHQKLMKIEVREAEQAGSSLPEGWRAGVHACVLSLMCPARLFPWCWARVLARARVHGWFGAGVDVNLANAVGKEVWTMHGHVCTK